MKSRLHTLRRHTAGACALATLLTYGAQTTFAQTSPPGARLSGTITDKGSGSVVALAELLFVTEGRLVTSDSAGHYTFTSLPAGEAHIIIRARRYPTTEVIVEIKPGDDLLLPIELDSTRSARTAQLPAVAVTAPAVVISYRLVDFERRRHTGIGQFMTDDEIRSSGAGNLTDAIRGMRGLMVHCAMTECSIQMVRARINCRPEYFVDGQLDNIFGPLTPIRDIVALEVYTGASDVPGEFAGARAGCGVIALWTPSGPSHRKR